MPKKVICGLVSGKVIPDLDIKHWILPWSTYFVICELFGSDQVETCWVIGGLSVYAEALDHPGKEDNMYHVGSVVDPEWFISDPIPDPDPAF